MTVRVKSRVWAQRYGQAGAGCRHCMLEGIISQAHDQISVGKSLRTKAVLTRGNDSVPVTVERTVIPAQIPLVIREPVVGQFVFVHVRTKSTSKSSPSTMALTAFSTSLFRTLFLYESAKSKQSSPAQDGAGRTLSALIAVTRSHAAKVETSSISASAGSPTMAISRPASPVGLVHLRVRRGLS